MFDANGPLGDRVVGRDVPEGFEPLDAEAGKLRTGKRLPENRIVAKSTDKGIKLDANSSVSTGSVVVTTTVKRY